VPPLTRPRHSSGPPFFTVVVVAAICDVAANPTTNSTAADSQKTCDCENTIKPQAQITDIAAIHLAKPLYDVRAANCSAPSTAPTPAELISMPRPFAPDFS